MGLFDKLKQGLQRTTQQLKDRFDELFRVFADNDPALEWCENRLLASALSVGRADQSVPPGEYDLFSGLTGEELETIVKLLQRDESSLPNYEEAKDELAQRVYLEKMTQARRSWLDSLRRQQHVEVRL